tara:strand:- start:224 stop:505 length:282 start_codon:yes stop_codon:yes gene_type:complete
MRKKAVSQIVTTVLIILLVLSSIIVVWNVVRRTIIEESEDITTKPFSVGLSTSKASLSGENVIVEIKRAPGKGNLTSIKIILKDDTETYTMTN